MSCVMQVQLDMLRMKRWLDQAVRRLILAVALAGLRQPQLGHPCCGCQSPAFFCQNLQIVQGCEFLKVSRGCIMHIDYTASRKFQKSTP